jgi:hypothetical protein
MSSAALLQARLATRLPAEVRRVAERSCRQTLSAPLQVARSFPGIRCRIGRDEQTPAHVEENLALAALPPIAAAVGSSQVTRLSNRARKVLLCSEDWHFIIKNYVDLDLDGVLNSAPRFTRVRIETFCAES